MGLDLLSALHDKWKDPTVWGMEKAVKPSLLCLNNAVPALEMLHKHISNHSKIAVHCDVDMDGIGSGYITKRFLTNLTSQEPIFMINKDKEHGIKYKHAEFFYNYPIGLCIILDSSSNELDAIKKFNCDVLVVDHHEIDHEEYSGKTFDGHDFIIVNNMISNSESFTLETWLRGMNPGTTEKIEPYIADSRMSCGLVIYELLRIYQEAYIKRPILENMVLYQWVGITLFTDAIQLLTPRNQWYIEHTVHNMETEPTLLAILKSLNSYTMALDKSFINYTMAPVFNRAIRAGATSDALGIVIKFPQHANVLNQYRESQDTAIANGIQDIVVGDSYVMKDITNTDINHNYTGVTAGRLCDEHRKNAIVFSVRNGIAQGSFRGRVVGTDYRGVFNSFGDGTSGQGHDVAFGFACKVENLHAVMSKLTTVESDIETRYYLTAGSLPEHLHGVHHIDNIDEFKKNGGMMFLGTGNSKVGNNEQIMVTVNAAEAKLIETRGKVYIYNVLGLICKAFKEIDTPMINIYAEYSRSLELYIK